MDLNKHLAAYDTSRPLHNSGFAVVANGDHFGSTSNVSFDQRQQIERNRQLVASYQKSTLGNARGVVRAKPVARGVINRNNIPQRPSRQQFNTVNYAPRHFSEPTARAYNPYA